MKSVRVLSGRGGDYAIEIVFDDDASAFETVHFGLFEDIEFGPSASEQLTQRVLDFAVGYEAGRASAPILQPKIEIRRSPQIDVPALLTSALRQTQPANRQVT